MKTAISMSLMMLALLLSPLCHAQESAKDGSFKLYGFSLSDTIEQAIENALERNMRVEASLVPEKFKNNPAVKKELIFQYAYQDVSFGSNFNEIKERTGKGDDYSLNEIQLVENNERYLYHKGKFPLEIIRCIKEEKIDGVNKNLDITMYFINKADKEVQCFLIEFKGRLFNFDDFKDVFTERYGKPKNLSEKQAYIFWQKNGEIVYRDINADVKFVNYPLMQTFFLDSLNILKKIVEEKEQEKIKKKEERSKKNKSEM